MANLGHSLFNTDPFTQILSSTQEFDASDAWSDARKPWRLHQGFVPLERWITIYCAVALDGSDSDSTRSSQPLPACSWKFFCEPTMMLPTGSSEPSFTIANPLP